MGAPLRRLFDRCRSSVLRCALDVMAAHNWEIEAGRESCARWRTAHFPAEALACWRGGAGAAVSVKAERGAPPAGDPAGTGRPRNWRDEGFLWQEPEDPAGHLCRGAADRLRECG